MISAVEALCHEFFDELRVEGARLPNGKPMPELFNWTKEGELLSATCGDTHTREAFETNLLSIHV